MVEPGRLLANRYRLDRLLGEGGMGQVWIATHVTLDKLVAVKLMLPEAHADGVLRARFEREARLCAQIRSPHVVQLFDFGVEDDLPYLVMELLEGEDIATWRTRRAVFPLGEVGWIVSQAAAGLGAAHDAGIVHRDVKPSNLFVARDADDSVLKILDFGIAKAFERSVDHMTGTNVQLGSPRYMSPEQVQGDPVDGRADLWSLGVVAYLLLTGEAPFQGTASVLIAQKIVRGERRRPSQVMAGLPSTIDAFFDRALAVRREDRFPSAEAFAVAFERVANEDRAAVARVDPPTAATQRPSSRPRVRHETTAPELAAGDILGGKYRIDRVIGRGGMGVVLEVRHLGLDESRALKLMLPKDVELPRARERFFREARAAVKLRSEHAVRVHDVGLLPDGSPYIEMELLQGIDLASAIQAGPTAMEDAVAWIAAAAEAVEEAHRAGIVHRDIKPGNLFLARRQDGTSVIKVLDFGIAKDVAGNVDMSLTSTHASFGSPLYMSPEQMRGARHAEPRSDIWALGVVLYELLTRRRPFERESVTALALAVASDPVPAPSSLRPEVPRELEAITLRCLEKDVARRFATAGELARALRAVRVEDAAVDTVGVPPRVSLSEPPERTRRIEVDDGAQTGTTTLQTTRSRSRGPAPTVVVGAAAAATIVVAAIVFLAWPSAPALDAAPAMPVTSAPVGGSAKPAVSTTRGEAPTVQDTAAGPSASATPAVAASSPPGIASTGGSSRARPRPGPRPKPTSGFGGVQ